MKQIKNVFGEGELYTEADLKGKIYITSAACMSVWSDFLSWANVHPDLITLNPDEADTIVVLGCQVTDLAVLNDLRIAEALNQKYQKDIFMGGCLSQRFDIPLPDFIKRLDVVRVINQDLEDRTLVHYEKPFWVPDFKDSEAELADGNLFRNMYPLKIGAGCHGRCKYCTIRHTRGETYVMDAKKQVDEFLAHDDIVLISDSPTKEQIDAWCEIALTYHKPFSIRNVEPQVLVACEEALIQVAANNLLKILHCPVQSFDPEVLTIMNRSAKFTALAVALMQVLRSKGVIIATNIIIDYVNEGKNYPNYDQEKLDQLFDYYSWNPYFDGQWDREKAEKRMGKYIK